MSSVPTSLNSTTANLPPMLQQYVDYKVKYPDCLLFCQVGDFYELFFEDAVTVARTLNLTLTSRDKNSDNPIPMCGVPIAVVDAYVTRLVAAKFSVAIVSQCASIDAKGKQVITRFLERIVTPGIKILGNADKDGLSSIVASVFSIKNEMAIAFSNVQTGKILIRENISPQDLVNELGRVQPIEIIIPDSADKQKVDRRTAWVSELERRLTYSTLKTRRAPVDGDSTGRDFSAIKGYSALSTTAKKAVQLLTSYIDETTVTARIEISEIAEEGYSGLMSIDSTSKRNLELVQNLKDGSSEVSLFDFLNHTVSAGGERLLRFNILNPLTDLNEIKLRQELVAEFLSAFILREDLTKQLKYISDLERLACRVELQAILPKEAAALRDSLEAALRIKESLASSLKTGALKAKLLSKILAKLDVPKSLTELLSKSILDSPEVTLTLGGIIRDGYNKELDSLREIKTKGSSWIAELEATEKARTGINSLKIKYNNVIGYFIEITAANSSKVPEDFIRKQTTANTERFTTHELKAREKDLVGAESKVIELERRLFEEVRKELKTFVLNIRKAGEALSELDFFLSLATCSERYELVQPVVNDSSDLIIEEGKHPVLMKILKESYVPTSLDISESGKNFLIITGPNMGGKSTYLRQAALLVILSQMGSNVPAKSAKVGLVDKIFARLGASDNQREGESTFMVEMREASHIIANAGPKSLLLIDEIGRGTATFDGLSIAQAILEWIVDKITCRSLFATHFHELTKLESVKSKIANYSVSSYEEDGDVIFTHSIVPGPASSSYGIEVAKLAGLPEELLLRARNVLIEYLQNRNVIKGDKSYQLSFFESQKKEVVKAPKDYEALSKLKKRIIDIEVNELTPLESLNILSELIKDAKS